MKQTTPLPLIAALFVSVFVLQSWAAAPSNRWTLATADTRLVIGVSDDNKLCVYELSSPAGWNWTAMPSPLPLVGRVDVGGAAQTPKWVFKDASEDKTDGTKISLNFTSADPALELTSIWHARGGPGPVRHTMLIRNNSGKMVTIYEQESLDVHLVGPGSDTTVCYINDDGSIPDATGVFHDKLPASYRKSLPISESQDFIPLAILDANGTQGVYIGWEWSIGRIAIAAHSAPAGAHVQAGNGDTFKTDLEAGATFQVPPGFIGAYKGDLDDAANSLHKYLFNYSMPAVLKNDASYPKVQWNAFAATGKGQGSWDSTGSKYYPLIDDAAPLGFEEVVLDIGWWPGDASHKPHPPTNDPVDWPLGMPAASDYAHKHGMRFGLYWNCNPPMTTREGIQHRQDDVKYLYDKFHVDFFRSDGTDGNVLQTGGFGPAMRAHYAEDAGYWQTAGYYEVLDSLYAAIPKFSYENCSGGGRIKDYGILKRCMKIQNQDTYYPIDVRRSFYDASFALHPMQIAALVGSWSDWQATGSVYEFRAASMGAAYWHPDAPNGGNGGPVWSVSQKAIIKDAVNTYKTRIRPLVRSANIYHIFPRPDDKIWDGVEYFDPTTKKGAVYVFRPDSPAEMQTVRLKGLDEGATYWLSCEDGSIEPTQQTGRVLMQTGLTIRLSQRHTSDIIFIQDAVLGRPDDLVKPGEFALKNASAKSGMFSASAELSWEASSNARLYRVTVGETPELGKAIAQEMATTPSVLIGKLPAGSKVYWKVDAILRGGTTPIGGAAGSFTTPEALAKDITFASDMKWVKAIAGAEQTVHRDGNLKNQPIRIDGKLIEKGLWTHSFNDNSPADIVFDISGRKFASFKASVGLDDLGERGSVQFQVLVDGRMKAESPVVRPKKTHELAVDVTGAKEITLRVLNGGDGYGWDHAVWGFARFLEAGTKDPLDGKQ